MLEQLSGDAWPSEVERLIQADQLDDLWRLSLQVAPTRAVPVLRRLGDQGWRPRSKRVVPYFEELVEAARACPPELPVGTTFGQAATVTCGPSYQPVSSLAISPDGTLLATGGSVGGAQLWHLRDGARAATLAELGTDSLEFTADGRYVVGIGRPDVGLDEVVLVWEVSSGRPALALECPGVQSLAVTPDTRHVAAGSKDGTVRLWELPGGRQVATLTGPKLGARTLRISADGESLAAAAGDGQISPWNGFGCIQLWKLPSAEPAATISRGGGRIDPIAFTAGELIAGVGDDGFVRLWQTSSGEPAATLDGSLVFAWDLLTARDGELLIAGGYDATVRVWDVASRQSLAVRKQDERVNHVAVNASGTMMVTGNLAGIISWWDLPEAEPGTVRHQPPVESLAVSPDDETVVSGHNGEFVIWRSLLRLLGTTPYAEWDRYALSALTDKAERQPSGERAWITLLQSFARAQASRR